MKKIPLLGVRGKDLFALVDDEDYEPVRQHKWYLSTLKYAYARESEGHTVFMHRFIMQAPKGLLVDHQNHQKLDNQKSNLRICTQTQNHANMVVLRANTSGYKGVYWHEHNQKWASRIQVGGKSIWLGGYDDARAAALAYDAAALKLYGEFAWPNFPPSPND